ncbi:MAG: hypothetical protein IJZ67_03880 [Alistipes sp.]|nr:hypothetical protein [Alistipes sp.]
MKWFSLSRLYAVVVLLLSLGYWGLMSAVYTWVMWSDISWRYWYLALGWLLILLAYTVGTSPWVDYALRIWRDNNFSPWLIDAKEVAGKVSSALYTLLSIVTLTLPFVLSSDPDFANRDFDILAGFNIAYLLLTLLLIVRKIYLKRRGVM